MGYPEEVISLAKTVNNDTQIHTFGIGYGSSKYLIREVAKAGMGSSTFLEDPKMLNDKIIAGLKRSIYPSL